MCKYLLRLMLTSTFILIASVTLISQVKTDTLKSGSGFWKPPVGCNSFYVELWGGGAGGNTGSGDGSLSTGGGGGGSYAKSTNFLVTSSTFNSGYQFSVGSAGGTGSNGGDTWFFNTNCLAPGGKTRGNTQQKSPLNQFIQTSYLGGGGGSSWRNVFNQIWHGGGGGAGRRAGNGYVGGNADYNFTGGGAEGYAYDNVNVTPGRGGQDGPYFPGIPGGGGAGNQSGAGGIIIIFYTCDYNPGSITESHTVPSPAEWPAGNDPITNTAVPTPANIYNYNYIWETSKNNVNWTTQPAMGTALNSFVQDSITLNTYYRRTITNGCGTNNSTDPILIKVFKATSGKNGQINGRVSSRNNTGVGGVSITIKKTIALRGSPQYFEYKTTTNPDGYYKIDTLFYGDRDNGDLAEVKFSVVASLAGHKIFRRNADSLVSLSFGSNVFSNFDFIDSTVYSVTGRITQTCDSCLPGFQGPFGVGNVKVSAGTGIIDVYSDSLRVRQDSIGYFGLTLANPGDYTFIPNFLNHKFLPISQTLNIKADKDNLNFADTTTRLITGKLVDVTGKRIGSGSLIFEGVYQRKDSTPVSTFRKRATINANDSSYSVRVPAGLYRISVETFASAYDDNRYVPQSDVFDFFNVRAIEPIIDVNREGIVRDLIYHRPPVIVISGLVDTLCNSNLLDNPGLVFRSNIRKYFKADVFEGPPSLNNRVQPSNPLIVDSSSANQFGDFLRIWTDVNKFSATASADTVLFRLGILSANAMVDTFILPGAPNTVAPYQKKLEFHFIDRYGRVATKIAKKATVLGIFNPQKTFTTAFPEVPYLILHAPPGDQSFSFWTQNVGIETTTSFQLAKDSTDDGFVNVSLGPKFSFNVGPISVEAAAIATLNSTRLHTISRTSDNELTDRIVNTNTFQTTKNDIVTGTSGDVYIGAATNYLLGRSISVEFNKEAPPNGCFIDTASRLIMAPEGFRTEFAYAEDHIVNVIIPTQQQLADQETDLQKKSAFLNQVSIWQQVIKNNEIQKQQAAFKVNRSFSNGAFIEESQTGSTSKANTITYDVELGSQVAFELGLSVGGVGVSGGANYTFKQTTGNSTTTNKTTETTIGYHLEDNDRGDYYSVDIKTDPVYGTPVFDLVAGTSSCPPEQGAQNRDIPQIISGDMKFDNLDPSKDTTFIMTLTNKSESAEARFYTLSVDATTSVGLTVTSDGVNLKSNATPFYLAYGQTLDVPIKVEKSNKPDKIYSYPSIEFYLADNCGITFVPNTYNTAKITLNYKSPNGGITLTNPANGWLVNKSSPSVLPITMSDYNLGTLDSVVIQYKTDGVRIWKNAFTVRKAAINSNSYTYNWDITNLQDSVYNLRLKLVSTDGSVFYSDYNTGAIDRKAPSLVGKPQPVTKLYKPDNGEISFTYNEALDNSNLNIDAVQLIRRSNNSTISISVNEQNGKIIINPTADLGYSVDSFMVIVKNVTDLFGNVKTKPDTSFFKLDLTVPLVNYTGTNKASVTIVKPSIAENSTDSMELRFKLSEKVTTPTKIYFNLFGTANNGIDYAAFYYDTIVKVKCAGTNCDTSVRVVYANQFSGPQGFVYIDSNKTETVIKIAAIADNENEPNETIIINLLNGPDYIVDTLAASVTGTILNAALPCPPSNILYVNAAATGNNSGISWANAMRSLKEALNRSCPNITQIWVARGTYKPTTNMSRDSSFVMRNNLAIYGGFAGTETLLSQRNLRNNPTILSGDIGTANNNADNSYNIVRNISNGLNSTAILDGFIVTGGRGNGAGFGSYGAGIINVGSTPSFFNCSIIGNSADAYGGGMYNNGSSPLVVNSMFAGNTALYGGGLYNESAATKLINCSFSANLAFAEGGAISTYGAVTPVITNSILWGNSSGIRDAGGSTPAVSYSIVQGGYGGTGNLNTDPLFVVQPAPGLNTTTDVRLVGCSPAINAGSNTAVPAGVLTDLGSLPRIANSLVDMGAYERQSSASGIIYVDSSAKGNNSGDSWANAYPSLSSALTELNLCSPGTTIQVAAGTYIAPVNNTYNFDKLGAVILGGYPSGGGVTRNPAANRVVLKGNVQVLKSVRMDGIYVQKLPNGTGKLSLIQQTVK